MSDNPRALRLADRIKEIVATTIDKRIKDPRLGFVTITDVRVSGDLQHASVFYTVLGTEEERLASGAALTSATGMLRSEVGRQLSTRLVPTLEFIPDALPENADHISALLREAQQRGARPPADRVRRPRLHRDPGAGRRRRCRSRWCTTFPRSASA